MVLEQFHLVGLVKLDAFAQLPRFSLLHQSRLIRFHLGTHRIIFHSGVKSHLPFRHFICLSSEHIRPFCDFLGLFGLPVLNFGLVGSDLFLNLSVALLLLPGFLLDKPLTLLIFFVLELRGLVSYLGAMLFLLHFLEHGYLLLAEFALPPYLLDNLHFALVFCPLLLKIRMLFTSDPVSFHEFEICFEFLALLFNLSLYHLDRLILQLLLFSVPVSQQGFFFLLKPALVLEESVQLVKVVAINGSIHAKFNLHPIHILLSSCVLALSLILVKNG